METLISYRRVSQCGKLIEIEAFVGLAVKPFSTEGSSLKAKPWRQQAVADDLTRLWISGPANVIHGYPGAAGNKKKHNMILF